MTFSFEKLDFVKVEIGRFLDFKIEQRSSKIPCDVFLRRIRSLSVEIERYVFAEIERWFSITLLKKAPPGIEPVGLR